MFYGPGDLRLEDIEPEKAGPGEVRVEIHAAATCGTDLKSYRRGHPTLFPVLPARFGHEFAGNVIEIGEGVTKFAVGDRVVAQVKRLQPDAVAQKVKVSACVSL